MSEFSERVYEIVAKIPKGSTMTYKELAAAAGRPKAWRAVGNVLNKNPKPGTEDGCVPCHRVIRSDRKLGGYALGSSKKKQLLRDEGAI
jgi:O-6-methylguanine DNA methyltransferase